MKINLKEIRQQFLLGDNQFLTHISREYGLYCIRYLCNKHKCDEDEARGIFTDAMMAFRDSIIKEKMDQVRNLKSYLLGTCLNLFQVGLRAEKRKIDKSDSITQHLYDDNPNYLDNIIEKESKTEMKKITHLSFQKLDEGCQKILKLFYIEELTMSEIAKEIGLSSDQVAKTTKFRCYKKWVAYAIDLKKKVYVD